MSGARTKVRLGESWRDWYPTRAHAHTLPGPLRLKALTSKIKHEILTAQRRVEETKIRISVIISQMSRKTAEKISIKEREMEPLLSACAEEPVSVGRNRQLGILSVKSHSWKNHSERHFPLEADERNNFKKIGKSV